MPTFGTLFKIFIGTLAVFAAGSTLLVALSVPRAAPLPLPQEGERSRGVETTQATSSGTLVAMEEAARLADADSVVGIKNAKTISPPLPVPPHAPASKSVVPEIVTDERNISAPGPLVVRQEPIRPGASPAPEGLVAEAIVRLTNTERAKGGLPALAWNARLGAMAEAKAFDMIARQYFAHEAPDGSDIGDLAEKYGYAYLNIGENLALGDFATSGAVVAGWMNSPGHRANIMSATFREIGVASLRGTWEGREVWFAVQEFGRPLSACPLPDTALKAKIALWEDQVGRLAATLEGLKRELEEPGISRESYNAKVNDYNAIVALYNKLVGELKADIAAYNTAVDAFNDCAAR